MSIVTKYKLSQPVTQGGVPFGNHWLGQFAMATTAGVLVDSNQSTALQVADVVRLGIIPAGTTLHDITAIISAAFAATSTASVGFAYADGVDSTAVPQDAAYFLAAGTALSAVAVLRKTNTKSPITLPKDAYLTVTLAGVAQTGNGIADFLISGVQTGRY